MNKNFKARLYQEIMVGKAVMQNTLIVLPTGLGKTAIAVMLAKNRLDNYPNSKILFLAPTKPLAQQHEETFKDLLESYAGKTVLFTGSVSPEKRKKLWNENRIIISTPQGMENDVISRKIKLEEASLIVFDECHRATGDYAYVFLAKKYVETAKHPRILGLTASPGSDTEKILEIAQNLFIEDIEYRNVDDIDVKPYVQDMNVEYVKVELTEDLKRLKMFLDKCYISKLNHAIKLGYLHGSPSNYSKTSLLGAMAGLHGKIAQGEKDFEILKTVSLLAEAMKISHALELVETQGVPQVKEYLEGLDKLALTSKTKAVKNLVKDLNFRSALILAKTLEQEKIVHPKLEELERIVGQEVTLNPKTKIIIFTQFRDTATKIKEILDQLRISSEVFVGQAKKKNTGLSQKEQKEMIRNFKNEEFSCLIATSVGEEGLDIPEVDLVLFYEPIPSAIRTVQRRGRTGRQKEGRVIILLTKDTRDESYRWSAHHKEKRMYRVLKTIKDKLRQKENVPKTLHDYEKSTAVIKVDYREKGSAVIKELMNLGVDIDLEQLQIGDYLLSEHVAVEFKNIRDFVDSIIDGRLLSQARDLKQYSRQFMIVEGDTDIYSQRRIHPNAIRGMIATLTVNMRIPIIWTKNAKETAAMLKLIAEREQDPERKDFQMHSAKPMTDNEILEYVVSAFPGIGARLSPFLLKHFGSIKEIINAEEKELKEVELIGEKKAKRLKEITEKKYKN